MSLKEIISGLSHKSKERKELFKQMQEQDKMQEIIEERKMSANERELRRFMKENREDDIKIQLDKERKLREDDIKFNHNPLNVQNITKETKWSVLKEKNMFVRNKNMFSGNNFIHNDNPRLLKNSGWLMK